MSHSVMLYSRIVYLGGVSLILFIIRSILFCCVKISQDTKKMELELREQIREVERRDLEKKITERFHAKQKAK